MPSQENWCNAIAVMATSRTHGGRRTRSLLRQLVARLRRLSALALHDSVEGLEIGARLAILKELRRFHRRDLGSDRMRNELIPAGTVLAAEASNFVLE